MSFAENLKQIRKERGLSQEELAEMMEVSRQAVSKWEQGLGYPEVEKLLIFSSKFNISLDSLMATEIAKKHDKVNMDITGTIVIKSNYENVIVTCCKVLTSSKMKGGKNAPQYALFGIGSEATSFWGEQNTFLGWYADEQAITKEVDEIQQAIFQGVQTYELKYNVKVERKWLRVKIIEE